MVIEFPRNINECYVNICLQCLKKLINLILWQNQMFARCLHFWAKMLVSWDRQTQSHWSTAVAPFRGVGCDTEGRGELRAFGSWVPLETGLAGPTNPSPTLSPPPLQSSYDGNTGSGLWIIGNFNPLKAIIQSKTFQIYSSGESSCLSQARVLVLETSCHVSARPFSLFCPFPLWFDSFEWYGQLCVCMCTLQTVWLRLK